MTQVQDMTDQQLNVALAELTGFPIDKVVPNYCSDIVAAQGVQEQAMRGLNQKYLNNLERVIVPTLIGQPECENWHTFQVVTLLRATPRQRAEAAYLTLSQMDDIDYSSSDGECGESASDDYCSAD